MNAIALINECTGGRDWRMEVERNGSLFAVDCKRSCIAAATTGGGDMGSIRGTIAVYGLIASLLVVCWALAFVLWVCVTWWLNIRPQELSVDGKFLYVLGSMAFCASTCLISLSRFVKWVRRRWSFRSPNQLLGRRSFYVVSLFYIVTSVAGSPAVQSVNTQWATHEYLRLHDEDHHGTVEVSSPYIHTYMSVPILPLVLASYHEYQLAGVYGWGGWDVQIWYVCGVKRLVRIPCWKS